MPRTALVPELDTYRASIVASLVMTIGSVATDRPSGSSKSQLWMPASISTIHGEAQTLSKLADELTAVLVAKDTRPRLLIDVPKVDTVPLDVPLWMLNVAPTSGDLRRTVTLDADTTLKPLSGTGVGDLWDGPAVSLGVAAVGTVATASPSWSSDESSVPVNGEAGSGEATLVEGVAGGVETALVD